MPINERADAARAHGLGVQLEPLPDAWNEGGSQIRSALVAADAVISDLKIKNLKTWQTLNMWRLAAFVLGGCLVMLIVFGRR